uniref:Uncharacterized protein n=1 Tax=Opuntia streptacantha TaxID=393608 RepID=A0A7C9DU34_OPUST
MCQQNDIVCKPWISRYSIANIQKQLVIFPGTKNEFSEFSERDLQKAPSFPQLEPSPSPFWQQSIAGKSLLMKPSNERIANALELSQLLLKRRCFIEVRGEANVGSREVKRPRFKKKFLLVMF